MKRAALSDMDAVASVALLNSVPADMPEPAATAIRATFAAAHTTGLKMSLVLAVWPDGTWAMLAHDPDRRRPRPSQIVRAYRTAYAQGICLPALRRVA